MPEVTIYTDGACSGNPGPGGFGIVMMSGGHRREIAQGFRRTTNNRMELRAVITALETLKKPCRVVLYSDSEYVVNAINKRWIVGWQLRGWKRGSRKSPVANSDLWRKLVPLLEHHSVEFRWVRGHSNNVENERCDRLAVEASLGSDLQVDEGFTGSEEALNERGG